MSWQDTGTVAPKALSSARLKLHYGAFLLGSTAHSVLDHAADDSHTNLGVDLDTGSLATRDLPGGLRLHLDFAQFALSLRAITAAKAEVPLDGRTVDEALAWVGEALAADGTPVDIARREYPDFPDSPLLSGAAFAAPPAVERTELGRWFGNAQTLFAGLGSREPRMTPPRVWPHHFDLGALIPLSADGQVTIGVGFAPGDAHYDQPYFYCAPYPVPAADTALPALPIGHWTTDGMTSAILTATELQAAEATAGAQGAAAQQYLDAAVAQCRELLQGSLS
ncbi:MAG: hypothetical protein AAF628_05950 [Planctomycetota bacterium]